MVRIAIAAAAGVVVAVLVGLAGGRPRAGVAAPRCARRVVSLAPHATESLFAIGAGALVVGVDDYSREPPAVRALPKVGAYIDPDLEAMVALRPDLVVVTPGQRKLAEDLEGLGLAARIVPDTRLADVFETIDALGTAVCREEAAASLARALRTEVDEPGGRAAGGRPVRAVLVVDRPPDDLRQFYVAGPDNFLSDVLRAAGAENAFAGAPSPFPQVSLEPIVAADPDLILELAPGADRETAARRADTWRRLVPGLRAVRNDGVHVLTETWLPVPGPSVGRAVRLVAGLVDDARGAGKGGR